MKVYLVCISILFCSLRVFSQVGVNTTNPRGILHIDGKGNTPDSGVINPNLTTDDVLFTDAGVIGIGTLSPIAGVRADIRGKVRIDDGTVSPVNYALLSDADGIGHWMPVLNKVKIATTLGVGINRLDVNTSNQNVYKPTGGYIDVPQGLVLIQASLYNHIGDFAATQGQIILRYAWHEQSNEFSALAIPPLTKFHYENTGGWGVVTTLGAYPNYIMTGSGYWAINNTSGGTLRLYLFAALNSYNIIDTDGVWLYAVGAQGWSENMISISPIENI
ncbi:hypothetical protein [Dysgonomonas sp. GY617]|uniref:hypothetical protein n=1 Tax=Dysgonomonas sp. GY617 TaxID=2780420 RepID=UPI00188366BE|nr:hypothetical protein [Dysgonomonas sp. GY617]MBF0577216.1 hypothetical protein [Dysgonomonas sp. GY617]